MNKERKSMYISIIALIIAVIGVTIGYAALSTSLKVKFGTVTQSKFNWNVKLTNGEITGVNSGTSATTCGVATVTDNEVSIEAIKLAKPGDKCSYQLNVKNEGDVDAVLSNISSIAPEGVSCKTGENKELVCGNVTYSLATDALGTTPLTVGQQRVGKINGTSDFYLVVSYKVNAASLNEEVSHTGAGFTVVYSQD